MEARKIKLLEFIGNGKKTFNIPVYQRNYDWKEEQCRKLFEDIQNIVKSDYEIEHFLGTVVFVSSKSEMNFNEYVLIDGQQRITSIMLLLKVLHEKVTDENDKEEIWEEYLINKRAPEENLRIRLKPVESDGMPYKKLIEENDISLTSNVCKNYRLFEKLIQESNYSAEEIYKALGKIELVYIQLEKGKKSENPQMIFESLNSTGLSLTQGDLIRNYILMDLEREKQNLVYKNLWLPIENNCKISLGNEIKNYVSDFIRDYLTLKNGKIPSKPKVFEEFKEFYDKNNDEQLEDIKNFSEEYSHIIKPNTEKDKDIRKELENLKVLDQTVINTFLIGILRDYKENKIVKNEILEILKLLQSYIWRRFITEKPSNALNKIFQGMYLRISKDKKYYKSLEESLLNQDFPTDDELKEALKTKNVYKDKEKLRYVFKELENYNHNELIDFENEKITIEHIFPQKPNKSWKEKYSDYELEEMKTFKDTISNLTLTGSNANLGNKSFLEKRNDDIHGYKNSKLYLNKYLSKLNEWNLSAMEGRFEELFKNIVKIWKRPENSEDRDIEKVTFVLKGAASSGTGKLLAYEKFEILKGSIIVKGNKGNENVEKRNKRIIEELLENNLVEKDGNKYILKENYKVSSPSAAASLILGRNANGWKEWKTFDGKLLNEFRK